MKKKFRKRREEDEFIFETVVSIRRVIKAVKGGSNFRLLLPWSLAIRMEKLV